MGRGGRPGPGRRDDAARRRHPRAARRGLGRPVAQRRRRSHDRRGRRLGPADARPSAAARSRRPGQARVELGRRLCRSRPRAGDGRLRSFRPPPFAPARPVRGRLDRDRRLARPSPAVALPTARGCRTRATERRRRGARRRSHRSTDAVADRRAVRRRGRAGAARPPLTRDLRRATGDPDGDRTDRRAARFDAATARPECRTPRACARAGLPDDPPARPRRPRDRRHLRRARRDRRALRRVADAHAARRRDRSLLDAERRRAGERPPRVRARRGDQPGEQPPVRRQPSVVAGRRTPAHGRLARAHVQGAAGRELAPGPVRSRFPQGSGHGLPHRLADARRPRPAPVRRPRSSRRPRRVGQRSPPRAPTTSQAAVPSGTEPSAAVGLALRTRGCPEKPIPPGTSVYQR